MKVILSRKGLDSHPSPIIKSNMGIWEFHPLPNSSEISESKYSDLFLYDSVKISDFLKDIAPRAKKLNYCEINPDIKRSTYKKRSSFWKKNIAHVGKSQQHLDCHQIRKGDVFLFYSWFKKAELINGKFKYIKDKDYPKGFYAIYGYLQISEIYNPNKGKTPKWLDYHPFIKNRNLPKYKYDNSTIYTAEDYFKYPDYLGKSGSDIFLFNEDLILTKSNQQKKSIWELPIELHPSNLVSLSSHSLFNWTIENDKAAFQSAKASEFVFEDFEAIVEKWCIKIIRNHVTSS